MVQIAKKKETPQRDYPHVHRISIEEIAAVRWWSLLLDCKYHAVDPQASAVHTATCQFADVHALMHHKDPLGPESLFVAFCLLKFLIRSAYHYDKN